MPWVKGEGNFSCPDAVWLHVFHVIDLLQGQNLHVVPGGMCSSYVLHPPTLLSLSTFLEMGKRT